MCKKASIAFSVIFFNFLQVVNVAYAANESITLKAQTQPNILLIIADDAGYQDFGFQGSKVMKTPELDKLAEQSVQFSQAYVSAAVCGPSRAGLFTGKYQQRFGFEENNVPGYMSSAGLLADDMGLPVDQLTMADHLKSLGYQTALIGKWHQGSADRFHPLKRGFDSFYGFRSGARSYFSYDNQGIEYSKHDRLERNFAEFEEPKKYLTDLFADETSAVIELQAKQSAPFFTVLSFSAVHTPMEAKSEDLAMFDHLSARRKSLAAMNFAMDRAVGQVLDKLNQLKIADKTLVVFMNDNGGPTDLSSANNHPLSGTKASHFEGGIRIPFLMRWPDKLTALSHYQQPISTLDLLPTFYQAAGGKLATLEEIDGVDLLPFLTAKTQVSATDNQSSTHIKIQTRPHQNLYWKKENRGAIRSGDWKLMRFPDRPAELFNLANDPSELNNLASQQPDKVKLLYKALFQWELGLERPSWQLKRKFEGAAMERMDKFRIHQAQ
ncbi:MULTISPECIES: sulfatase-like hydrolase/transferase [unclassified Shewanella]|uniref:sulfatase-like hydrolase/transferase n=1 Tax=unclassified Shewanella TaxID=196818 RepID=UPI00354F1BB9